MAFRDENEALRQRRAVLLEEIEAAEGDVAAVRASLAEEAADVEREVRLRVAGAVTGVSILASIVFVIGVVARQKNRAWSMVARKNSPRSH